MARAPFKLRSGNASSFKNLGSSPAKQDKFASKEGKVRKKPLSPEYGPPKNNDDISTVQSKYPGPERDPVNNSSDTNASTVVKPKAKASPKPKLSDPITTPKTTRSTVVVPKNHPVTPPTSEQSKTQKGTVKSDGVTVGDVAQSIIAPGTNTKVNKELIKKGSELVHKVNKGVGKGAKKVWDKVKKVWNYEI